MPNFCNDQSTEVSFISGSRINSNVILRRSRAFARDRLGGWKQAPGVWPSFETFGAARRTLRMTVERVARLSRAAQLLGLCLEEHEVVTHHVERGCNVLAHGRAARRLAFE